MYIRRKIGGPVQFGLPYRLGRKYRDAGGVPYWTGQVEIPVQSYRCDAEVELCGGCGCIRHSARAGALRDESSSPNSRISTHQHGRVPLCVGIPVETSTRRNIAVGRCEPGGETDSAPGPSLRTSAARRAIHSRQPTGSFSAHHRARSIAWNWLTRPKEMTTWHRQ